MKRIILVIITLTTFISCQQNINKEPTEVKEIKKEEITPDRSKKFPEEIAAIFRAHGGIQAFDQMNTLIFELANLEGNEKHTIDLKSRLARIETDKFVLGFDGKEAWLEQDSTYFKGNPRFYHNLMFYFYAMPFVLGDDGIRYEKIENLKLGEQSYPGYKISYGEGMGDSPKDNYFLYHDPSTYQMKYLGYTVTFFSKETSEKISLIEYAEWNNVNGLLLPKTLKWREYKEGIVGDIKSERNFVNAKALQKKPASYLFRKPSVEKGEHYKKQN